MFIRFIFVVLVIFSVGVQAKPLDQSHAAWDKLLRSTVHLLADGKQTRVDYKEVQKRAAELRAVLDEYSRVNYAQFNTWSRPQQMAFLINSYNAFTVQLVLTGYPEISSIRDLGSPWKKRFFTLLEEERNLDWIEHDQLRARYSDPRVHASINCASIGCPSLRGEAFVADRLNAQLDDSFRNFLRDRTKNRVSQGRIEASAIFDWFGKDFRTDGIGSLEEFFSKYANDLTDLPGEQAQIKEGKMSVDFTDYDWNLNDYRR